MTSPAWDEWKPWVADRAGELSAALLFLTRLPLPHHAPAADAPADAGLAGAPSAQTDSARGSLARTGLAQAAWAFPLAGFVVGLIGAVAYAVALRLVPFPWPAAVLALAATLLATGALHEDGLADTADGFGGGTGRERKLEIMRDARIGSYGVCALVLSLLLRAGALASLTETGLVAAALIAAHAGARAAMAAAMFFVPPARSDGLSAAAGQPPGARAALAAAIGFLIVLFCLGPGHALVALIALVIAVAIIARLAMQQIGGQTGDVLGAIEQVSEIVILLAALR